MAAPQNFRSAFNGFNREDVVHYLEYLNTKHKNQIDQLTAENQELQAAANRRPLVDQEELMEYMQSHSTEIHDELEAEKARCADLEAQLEAEKARCADLEAQLEAEKARCAELTAQLEALQSNAPQTLHKETAPVEILSPLASEELEAYRRAERIEREAKERAELVYFQANGVLTEAAAAVDGISNDITDMADQVMRQLTQLQMAVSSSKQALQDASSLMSAIRPNK